MVLSFNIVAAVLLRFLAMMGDAAGETDRGTDIIFFGNPGAGKSTLLSSLSGHQFASGTKYVGGLTSSLRWQDVPEFPGVRYGDTPGLADVRMAAIASDAIFEALNDARESNHIVKLVFVITEEGGRLRPEDLFTIKQVLESITLLDGNQPPSDSFALLVNKCEFLDDPNLSEMGRQAIRETFQSRSASVPFRTKHIEFLPMVEALASAANATWSFTGLTDFLHSFPGVEAIAGVSRIDTRDIDEQLAEAHEQYMTDLARKRTEAKLLKDEIWSGFDKQCVTGVVLVLFAALFARARQIPQATPPERQDPPLERQDPALERQDPTREKEAVEEEAAAGEAAVAEGAEEEEAQEVDDPVQDQEDEHGQVEKSLELEEEEAKQDEGKEELQEEAS